MAEGKKGLNKAQIGDLHYSALKAYIERRTADGTLPRGPDGRLKRTLVAEELRFSRSVFAQNPRIKQLLAALEGEPGPDESATDHRAATGRSEPQMSPTEVKRLQARVLLLEEENRYLRAEIQRRSYADFEVPATGRLPW